MQCRQRLRPANSMYAVHGMSAEARLEKTIARLEVVSRASRGMYALSAIGQKCPYDMAKQSRDGDSLRISRKSCRLRGSRSSVIVGLPFYSYATYLPCWSNQRLLLMAMIMLCYIHKSDPSYHRYIVLVNHHEDPTLPGSSYKAASIVN